MSSIRHVSFKLSASGKALLVYDEFGNSYMTSCYMVRQLMEGKLRGGLLVVDWAGNVSPLRFASKDARQFRSELVQGYGSSNGLSPELDKERRSSKVVVDDDW